MEAGALRDLRMVRFEELASKMFLQVISRRRHACFGIVVVPSTGTSTGTGVRVQQKDKDKYSRTTRTTSSTLNEGTSSRHGGSGRPSQPRASGAYAQPPPPPPPLSPPLNRPRPPPPGDPMPLTLLTLNVRGMHAQ